MATFVFLVAEHYLHVSGILAVLAAGLVMGNYGRTKISPKVTHDMHEIWNMLLFIATSLVFLLIGYEIHIFEFLDNIVIVLAIIAILLLARSLSVYIVGLIYNIFAKSKIDISWLHIVNFGGLRGSLPLVVLLLLPEEFQYRELFIDLTLGIIFFTLLFNASLIKQLILKLKVNKLRYKGQNALLFTT